ncbi:MAG TPA: hypothetical protein VM733_21120 [Thermoanaerobaculia bacterium]|nr:hypothetical protein [Thermoanaerobaculia bacterium]
MSWSSLLLTTFTCCALTVCAAKPAADSKTLAEREPPNSSTTEAVEREARATTAEVLDITVETYCSETKRRTPGARIRWSMPASSLSARSIDFAATPFVIETTIYKNGFERGLSVQLPVSPRAGRLQGAIAARASSDENARAPEMANPAFRIRLVDVEGPRSRERELGEAESAPSEDATEMVAAVEDLVPGVNYIWRVRVGTAAGPLVSPAIKAQAPDCPADFVERR